MKHSEIGLHIRTYEDEGKSHSHDHHQLVLPLVGTLSLSVDAIEGEVAQHRAAIIPAGIGHGYAAALDKLPCFVDLDPALLHYIQFLHAQLHNGTESDFTQHQMLLLLIQLLQERHGSQLKLDRRVLAAKQLLDEHLSRPLSLAEAAAVAHLSISSSFLTNGAGSMVHQMRADEAHTAGHEDGSSCHHWRNPSSTH